MNRPDITPGPWTVSEAVNAQNCGLRVHTPSCSPFGAVHIYSETPNKRELAVAIAALPDCLQALELVHAYAMENPENRTIQALHLACTAALIKAGYTF